MRRLLVGLLALALAAAAAWVVARREQVRERHDRAEARLLTFDSRAVTGLVLTTPQQTWRFERGEEGWRMVSPVTDNASDRDVYTLLAVTQQTTVVETIDEPEALASYGLDPPFLTLRVLGPEVPVLYVGTPTPLNDGVFARIEGRPGVLVLDRWEAEAFRKDPAALRDRSLTGLLLSEVTALEIRRGAKRVRVEREGDAWWLTEPLRVPASGSAVDRVLSALDETAVMGFQDFGDPAEPRFGLDGPETWIVTLYLPDGSHELRIGAPAAEGARYAKRQGREAILAVPDEGMDALTVDPAELGSDTLTPYNRYRVARFDYRTAEDRLSAARDESGVWSSSDGAVLDEGAVYGLLVRTLEARVEGFDAADARSPGEPLATLDVTLEDGASDRISFLPRDRAVVASLPRLVFRLRSAPPAIGERLKSPSAP